MRAAVLLPPDRIHAAEDHVTLRNDLQDLRVPEVPLEPDHVGPLGIDGFETRGARASAIPAAATCKAGRDRRMLLVTVVLRHSFGRPAPSPPRVTADTVVRTSRE